MELILSLISINIMHFVAYSDRNHDGRTGVNFMVAVSPRGGKKKESLLWLIPH